MNSFNFRILQLLNRRQLEQLKARWWTKNPKKRNCAKEDDQSDGISLSNIGGVFIVIFVGIGMACFTLGIEYWWFRCRPGLTRTTRSITTDRKKQQQQQTQIINPLRLNLKPSSRPIVKEPSGLRSRF